MWEISNLIDNVGQDVNKLDAFLAHHCYKEANEVADLLANWGKNHQQLWLSSAKLLPWFSLIIRKNELGFPTIRMQPSFLSYFKKKKCC